MKNSHIVDCKLSLVKKTDKQENTDFVEKSKLREKSEVFGH